MCRLKKPNQGSAQILLIKHKKKHTAMESGLTHHPVDFSQGSL
jgi:hypothetical protein